MVPYFGALFNQNEYNSEWWWFSKFYLSQNLKDLGQNWLEIWIQGKVYSKGGIWIMVPHLGTLFTKN